jgi:cytochrome c556
MKRFGASAVVPSILIALSAAACDRSPGGPSSAEHDAGAGAAGTAGTAAPPSAPRQDEAAAWLLRGDADERFARVAKHLRGFDMAMVETGYRYTELYWAGLDGNWEYATYQLEKIRTTVNHGVERRPKRAESARMLEAGVLAVEEAVKARDAARFPSSFETLTAICNACHQAERVAFIHIVVPTHRLSPVRPSVADTQADAGADGGARR